MPATLMLSLWYLPQIAGVDAIMTFCRAFSSFIEKKKKKIAFVAVHFFVCPPDVSPVFNWIFSL